MIYDPYLLYLRISFALLHLCTPVDKLINSLGIYWVSLLALFAHLASSLHPLVL